MLCSVRTRVAMRLLEFGVRMKNLRFWLLLLLVVAARIVSLFFLKADPSFVFIPRSFVGGGFQVMPALLDLFVPIFAIFCLWPGRRFQATTISSGWLVLLDAASFLLIPLLAGVSLFAYLDPWQIFPNLSSITLLRWLEFIVTYLAWNLMLDELVEKRLWQKFAVVPLLVLSLGLFQDGFAALRDPFQIILSIGMTLTWTVLAFRRRFGQSPLAATVTAALIGGVSCTLVVMAPSNSALPPLLLSLAFLAGSLTLRCRSWWPRWIALAGIAAVGLFLSLVLPRFFPPEQRAIILNQDSLPQHSEVIEGITVRYDDLRVRAVALQMAHVLAAINQISQEAYGLSPQVNELVIRGFEAGGFQAQFPHSIHGNLISPRYVELCFDSAYLNDPNGSIHFPDPVNAILHEYSHLYGTVPYNSWLMGGTEGSEEEGWATFSATRLSRRLYERFGAGLWSPAYNYAARADAITQANLAGHSVYWSHNNEFGGFRLWYSLSQRDGEREVYRIRWAHTRRDGSWWFQINDPAAAREIAQSFGLVDFSAFGADAVVRFDQVHTLQDLQPLGEIAGWNAEKIKAIYERESGELIYPSVKVPAQRPFALDIACCLLFLVLFGVVKRVTRGTA